MKKRRFTYSERYAIWHCHGRRCWLCLEPLRLWDTTIDHFIPESLLAEDERRVRVLEEHGLPKTFDINGFDNWLPCHARCNQAKGQSTFQFVPGNMLVLQQLLKAGPGAERTAKRISSNNQKDKLFGRIFAALEEQTITPDDLRVMLDKFVEEPATPASQDQVVLLDNGHWVFRQDIARQCDCQCEREFCVGRNGKAYCYFTPDLSQWVIRCGLYWRCYDEMVMCPRCHRTHKRGHIGKNGPCGFPYRDQQAQTD